MPAPSLVCSCHRVVPWDAFWRGRARGAREVAAALDAAYRDAQEPDVAAETHPLQTGFAEAGVGVDRLCCRATLTLSVTNAAKRHLVRDAARVPAVRDLEFVPRTIMALTAPPLDDMPGHPRATATPPLLPSHTLEQRRHVASAARIAAREQAAKLAGEVASGPARQ